MNFLTSNLVVFAIGPSSGRTVPPFFVYAAIIGGVVYVIYRVFKKDRDSK
jgi:uncharacterized membrane protein